VFPTRLKLPNEKEEKVAVIESGLPEQESYQLQNLYDDQLRYFVRCIERKQMPVPGGQEGWTNMKVVDAAYESSRTGKVLDVK
jgi:predicted dehydrogenase